MKVLCGRCLSEFIEWRFLAYIQSCSYFQPSFGIWGRILGRNWDKSLKSFPPSYSQSPLLRILLALLPPPLSKSDLKLVLWCKHCICKPQVWELSRLCLETSLYVHEFGLCTLFDAPLHFSLVQLSPLHPLSFPVYTRIQCVRGGGGEGGSMGFWATDRNRPNLT